MATGSAKTDTVLPSQGVDPYKFGNVNIGEVAGKAIKRSATRKATVAGIKTQQGIEAKQEEADTAQETADRAEKSAEALGSIQNLSGQQFPASKLSSKPNPAAIKNTQARLKRQMAPGKPGKKKSAPMGNPTASFQEPQPTAVQAVKAARAKAKQVRQRKQTSLSTKPV